jgi:hypothetical protein
VAGQRQRLNFTDIAHLFLVPDTGPSDLFILFNCRYEMPACPEALTNPHLQRMTLSPWIKPGTRETSRFGGIAIILGTFVWSCRTDAGVSSTDNRGLLPEMSNFYCLPGRAGGSPIVLALLLDQVTGSVASATGDGAYDQAGVYAHVAERHPDATVIVPPRTTAVLSKTAETDPTQRDRHLQCIAKLARMGW